MNVVNRLMSAARGAGRVLTELLSRLGGTQSTPCDRETFYQPEPPEYRP